MNELLAPTLGALLIEPVLGIDPADEPGAVDPVGDPVPAAEPVVEPVAPGAGAIDPVLEPVALGDDPIDPLLEAPPDTLALVSMKPPLAPGELMLPVVPVAPLVAVPEAEAPVAPEPETRQPVTTTVCPLLGVAPVCPAVLLVVCAAAAAPRATAIIVPKRNCRFITSSVLS